jgi:hypothetical protein
LFLALTALLAAPAAAAGTVVYAGSDLWRTPGDGGTLTDFRFDPIPAGFFCGGSEPFAGRITFKGAPLATRPEGALGATDTLVQRLDDAVFDRNGVARTRIRVGALSFVSREPVATSCGAFNVAVGLEGPQPVTEMVIVRDRPNGGHFQAPISVVVRLVFTPAGGGKEQLELVRQLDFAPSAAARWSDPEVAPAALARAGFVRVDTDGDLSPDTYLPGTSNFAAGWNSTEGGTEALEQRIIHCGNPPFCTHNHTTDPVPVPEIHPVE